MLCEIRSDNFAVISGYVNVTGRESRVLADISGDFVEIVEPNTFAGALSKNDNVGLFFDHVRQIGSQGEKNLELREDNIGLFAKCVITDPDIIQKAKDNQLTGWSFGFFLNADEWAERSDGMRVRKVKDIDLVEVSILDVTPAYIATSIEMRGEKQALKEVRQYAEPIEVRVLPAEDHKPESEKKEPNKADNVDMVQLKRELDFIMLKNN